MTSTSKDEDARYSSRPTEASTSTTEIEATVPTVACLRCTAITTAAPMIGTRKRMTARTSPTLIRRL